MAPTIGLHASKVKKHNFLIHCITPRFSKSLKMVSLRFSLSKLRLYCSDGSDGPVCCDWSTAYRACGQWP